MTLTEQERIFIEYFQPSRIVGHDILCGDINISNTGLNSNAQHCIQRLKQDSMRLYALSDDCRYSEIEIMRGGLEDEDDISKVLLGQSKYYSLVDFTIIGNGNIDGKHFINLTTINRDIEEYTKSCEDHSLETWYKNNSCTMFYGAHHRILLLCSTETVTYLIKTDEDGDEASFVEVTEFVSLKKTRTFQRWFRKTQAVDDTWHVTIYASH